MLKWFEIKGLDQNLDYEANNKDVLLPDLDEDVLFCMTDYKDETKDAYFVGHISEDENGLKLVNSFQNSIEPFMEDIKWARFSKPRTKNNTGYAIAYLDKDGNNFQGNIPYIVTVEKDDIETKLKEFMEEGYVKITVFSYLQPCTFQYNWNYIEKNKVKYE